MPDDTPKEPRFTLDDLALGGLLSAKEYAALAEGVGKSIAAEKKRNKRGGASAGSATTERIRAGTTDLYITTRDLLMSDLIKSILKLVSPKIREELVTFALRLERQALETDNPFDDIAVDLAKAVLGIKADA